jgi:hypothetical protein
MNPIFSKSSICFALALGMAAALTAEGATRIKSDTANLRDYDGKVLCKIPKHLEVKQLEPVVGSWMKVQIDNAPAGCPTSGYVAKGLVEVAPDAEVASNQPIVEPENAGRAPALVSPVTELAGEDGAEAPARAPAQSGEPEMADFPASANTPGVDALSNAVLALPAPPAPVINPKPAAAANRKVTVTARGLNVRTADGEILCSVPKGTSLVATGRHGGGDRLKVEIKHPGCPKTGFVAETYVRPEVRGMAGKASVVDSDGLSFRSAPRLSQNSFQCALPKNTKLQVVSSDSTFRDDVSFVKVRLLEARKGCPEEGYVAEPYLRSPDRFADLPVIKGTEDCDSGNCGGRAGPRTGDPLRDMAGLSTGIGSAIGDEKSQGPFIEGLRSMMKSRKARPRGLATSRRGLVQMPLRGNRGPCGSFFYNASPHHIKNENRVYANPLTACVLTSVMQEWKKNICPSHQAGCRFSFGDISHPTDPSFMRKHSTHTDGHCVDIRPPRKGEFENSGMSYRWGGYDRGMMRKLAALVKKSGGTNIYFNDPAIRNEFKGVRRAGGHDNHIHVCFKDNPATRNTCDNLKVDPEVCPELQ